MGGTWSAIIAVALALLVGTGAQARIVSPELQRALRGADPEELHSVIVAFDHQETIVSLAREAGSRGREEIARTLQWRAERASAEVRALLHLEERPFRDLWIVNALAFEASAEQIELLAGRPEVAEIRLDGVLHLPELRPAQAAEAEWNLVQVGAPELWEEGIDGAGVVIAVIDSGVDIAHPALAGRWRGGANDWFNAYAEECTPQECTPCEMSADLPCDAPTGHGTAVTGIIGGGDVGGTAIGVAPGAQWIAAKVFRDDGTATFSAIHGAFQWILAMDEEESPDIVNNSWGLGPAGTCNLEFLPSIRIMQEAGVAVVSAAGNNGPGASTGLNPANYPESLAVGALDRDLNLASFSGRGPGVCDGAIFPDLTAPGVAVFSAAAGFAALHPFSGTSFAAPHLSGALALLRQGFPEMPMRRIERALLATALDLGSVGPDNGHGVGLIDIPAALEWLQDPPTPLLVSPRAAFVPFGSVAPGRAAEREIVFTNAANEIVPFELIPPSPPFSIEATCPAELAPLQECRAILRFAPGSLDSFSGDIFVQGAAGESYDAIGVEGLGNTPPRPARLLFPEDGALVGEIVTFQWQTPPDPDGHATADTLVISRQFETTAQTPDGPAEGSGGVLYAGAGGLLFALGGALLLRRHRRAGAALLLAAALLFMAACGGGNGTPVSQMERELEPGHYFWHVLTEDELGEVVSSESRSITVQ